MKHNKLVPELSVFNFNKSIIFYTKVLGFSIVYKREEESFAMLSFEGVEIMIDEIKKGRTWKTTELEFPLGSGINFQIEVSNIHFILKKLKRNSVDLFMEVEDKWYRKNNEQVGNRQFIVQDPNGYLIRFFEDLGTKSL